MNETSAPPTNDDQQPLCMTVAEQVVQELADLYEQLGLEKKGKDFGTEIYFPMLKSRPDPRDIEDELENRDISNIDLMKLSCAYAVLALVSGTLGDHENAWVAIGYAQYWRGVAYGSGVMAGQTTMKYRKRASAGGKANADANYGEVMAEAHRLAMNHLDGSRHDAAEQIRQAVIDFQGKTKPHFQVSSVDTIASWLTDLPFKLKRSRRKPNVKS